MKILSNRTYTDLLTQIKVAENSARDANKSKENYKSKAEELEKQNAALSADLIKERSSAEKMKNEIKSLEEKNSQLNKKIGGYESGKGKVATRDKRIKELEEELSGAKKQLNLVENQLIKEVEDRKKAEDEKKKLQGIIDNQNQLLSTKMRGNPTLSELKKFDGKISKKCK